MPKVMHPLAGAPLHRSCAGRREGGGVGRDLRGRRPRDGRGRRGGEGGRSRRQISCRPATGNSRCGQGGAGAPSTVAGPVIVLYGDTPLAWRRDARRARGELASGADIAVIGFEADDPTGYGRLLLDESGALIGHPRGEGCEQPERAIKLCNSGIMGFRQRRDADGRSWRASATPTPRANIISPTRSRWPVRRAATRACCAASR